MELGPGPITNIEKARAIMNSICAAQASFHTHAASVLLSNLSEKALAFAKNIVAILQWNMSEESDAGLRQYINTFWEPWCQKQHAYTMHMEPSAMHGLQAAGILYIYISLYI